MLSPVFFHGYLRKYPSPPDGFIMLIARTSTAETMQLITESKGAKAIAIAAKKTAEAQVQHKMGKKPKNFH